jgi:post-segregation antitoxin (ccd killing protein)
MANLTVTIPEDLREEIKEHKEVNWSEIVRRAMSEHLRKLKIANAIANKSQLTKRDVAELSKLVKQGIAKKHGL